MAYQYYGWPPDTQAASSEAPMTEFGLYNNDIDPAVWGSGQEGAEGSLPNVLLMEDFPSILEDPFNPQNEGQPSNQAVSEHKPREGESPTRCLGWCSPPRGGIPVMAA
jgi:hypothetical protein